MIDGDGFRPNVGIVICNRDGQVLWAKRYGQHSGSFRRGVDDGESPEQAMYRELYEEIGLKQDDVTILATSRNWLKYRLPKRLVRWDSSPVCIGQKQKWFLLQLDPGKESRIQFGCHGHPEFDDWRWVSFWYPVRQVVSFKREVYRRVMKEFAPLAMPVPVVQANRKDGRRNRSR